MEWLRKLEHGLLIVGALILALYASARVDRSVLSRVELNRFKLQLASSANEPRTLSWSTKTPDLHLWSEQRIKVYEKSLIAPFASVIAILRIPKIDLEVPVLDGTDDLSLNRGVGHVAGTANPGGKDNFAIAGHRDGFFRGLKDLKVGDRIEMVTRQRSEAYVIDHIAIVTRSDVSVLGPRAHRSLTLITCYPFYFIGSAPKRYIVQASLADTRPANAQTRIGAESEPETAYQSPVAR